MDWTDDDDLTTLGDAVIDATIALRVVHLFARPGRRATAGAGTNGMLRHIEDLLDEISAAPDARRAAPPLDRLCQLLAETASTTEHLARRPGAHLAWNELLHARAELALAYQHAATLRWRAWRASEASRPPVAAFV